MTMRYLEGLSAAAASALAIWVGFVMWLSWRVLSDCEALTTHGKRKRAQPIGHALKIH